MGLFPAVDACFNADLCATLYASATANANGRSDVEANAQLNAEPNAELNADVNALLIRLLSNLYLFGLEPTEFRMTGNEKLWRAVVESASIFNNN